VDDPQRQQRRTFISCPHKPFQLINTNDQPHDAYDLQDVANVPARGQIVIRMQFTDYTGKTVFHCHILNREDGGMMASLQIVE
jgi:suppressor of ftsI